MTKGFSKDFTELQAKYLEGVNTMSREEVLRLTVMLSSNSDAPYREDRISLLERRLHDIERQERLALEEKSLQAFYVGCGRKFRAIIERWKAEEGVIERESVGIYWHAEDGRLLLVQYPHYFDKALRIDELLAEAQRIDKEVFGREGD